MTLTVMRIFFIVLRGGRLCGSHALSAGEVIHRELGAVGEPLLIEDIADIILDRALGDEEFLGDLAVEETRRDRLDDLELARGVETSVEAAALSVSIVSSVFMKYCSSHSSQRARSAAAVLFALSRRFMPPEKVFARELRRVKGIKDLVVDHGVLRHRIDIASDVPGELNDLFFSRGHRVFDRPSASGRSHPQPYCRTANVLYYPGRRLVNLPATDRRIPSERAFGRCHMYLSDIRIRVTRRHPAPGQQ